MEVLSAVRGGNQGGVITSCVGGGVEGHPQVASTVVVGGGVRVDAFTAGRCMRCFTPCTALLLLARCCYDLRKVFAQHNRVQPFTAPVRVTPHAALSVADL